jgi:hypothetical protein
MEEKKRLQPIVESQRKIINLNRLEIEKLMTQLVGQVVSL